MSSLCDALLEELCNNALIVVRLELETPRFAESDETCFAP